MNLLEVLDQGHSQRKSSEGLQREVGTFSPDKETCETCEYYGQ